MRRILLLMVVAVLCACCSLNLPEAQVTSPAGYIYNLDYYDSNQPISARWWEGFEDPILNECVEQAFIYNRELAAAVSAVEAARHYIQASRAEFYPSLSFETLAELYHEQQVTEQEYTIVPTLEWEISLFGELRNTKRAAAAAFLQQEWNLRGVWLSLSSQVATSYFTLVEYQRSHYIATRSYELRCKATALVDSMYHYGMSSGIDLMQAKSLVYAAAVEVQKYERAVAQASLSLNALMGENPQIVDWEDNGRALITDNLPFDLPIGLPSTLLERQPDVMKSYYAMKEAGAKVGISRAERYPSITLSGSGGVYAASLKGLTSGDPLLWSATGEILAPIFSWGKLKRKEMIEREKYNACVEEYEQSVLEAFADVEQALVAINTCSSESAASTALVLANTKIAESTSALYRSGLSDYLSVIDAERELYSSQISLVDVVAQQYINYVELFKALGGGF